MLLSYIIDTEEEIGIIVIDIPNDFIHTQIDNKIDMSIINICSILVYMLLDINLDVHITYVTTEIKLIKQLITQFMNSIYGTKVASLLYYCMFCKTLKANKFKIKP